MMTYPNDERKKEAVVRGEAPNKGDGARAGHAAEDASAWQRVVLRPDGTPYCAEEMELLHEQIETYEKKDIPDWIPPGD